MANEQHPIQYASPVAYAKRVINIWAALGCVFAFGFFIPPVALVGTIVSWVGLRRAGHSRVGGRRAAMIGLWMGIFGLALVPFEVWGLHWAREQIAESQCRAQLLAIASSLQMYANNNRGYLPPDLPTFAASEDISPVVFVCRSSTDSVATSAPQMATPGHVSYVYLGHGQLFAQIRKPSAEVMLYELPNHSGGMHVAFYDGSVEFVQRRKAAMVLAELRAGQNPPPSLSSP